MENQVYIIFNLDTQKVEGFAVYTDKEFAERRRNELFAEKISYGHYDKDERNPYEVRPMNVCNYTNASYNQVFVGPIQDGYEFEDKGDDEGLFIEVNNLVRFNDKVYRAESEPNNTCEKYLCQFCDLDFRSRECQCLVCAFECREDAKGVVFKLVQL